MAEWLVSDSGCVPGLHTKTGKDLWAIPGNHPVLHKNHVSSDRWISGKSRRKSPKLWKCLHLANNFTKTSWRGHFVVKKACLLWCWYFLIKRLLPVRVEGAGSNVDAQLLPPKQNTKLVTVESRWDRCHRGSRKLSKARKKKENKSTPPSGQHPRWVPSSPLAEIMVVECFFSRPVSWNFLGCCSAMFTTSFSVLHAFLGCSSSPPKKKRNAML